ncbi:hypothetical protein J2128_002508 [Methanomicrobium sp. W14]|uniref:hypothetical protein n=1 Tax=Methanomicrobium sp. W14 TaxID=2817839 RepID=UPI001AE3B55A|nr:hypothetical protein [Methanomicrobium sp. W14]MBP2134537.1 hypothetical protein [Methanomicrobium sp. W14]
MKLSKLTSLLKFGKVTDHVLESSDSEPYSDSDTLRENYMQTYNLNGEKGTVFNIHYEGNAPVDLMILDPENNRIYNRLLDDPDYHHSINGYLYLNRREANIEFTQPDDQQYYFIIDNIDLLTNGANSGRSVKYTLTIS